MTSQTETTSPNNIILNLMKQSDNDKKEAVPHEHIADDIPLMVPGHTPVSVCKICGIPF